LTRLEASVAQLDPAAASAQLAAGAVALDVREDEEWEAGRIAGSVHIPLGALGLRQEEIPQAPLVVVCRTGSRSLYAASALVRAGYRASNLAGGLEAWQAAGLPLEPADGYVA
jgi:rhodanese-related sulfurtransferase